MHGSEYFYLSHLFLSGDYHSEVDSTIFQDWMLKTAELLPAGAVIVLDNASYHNTQVHNCH